LPDATENDLFTFICELLRAHRTEVELFLFGRKPALDLREPIPVTGEKCGDEEHEPADLQQRGEIRKIYGHDEGRDGNHHERDRQQPVFSIEIVLVVGDGDEHQDRRDDTNEGFEGRPFLGGRIADGDLKIDE
jgi:hypothetical protein